MIRAEEPAKQQEQQQLRQQEQTIELARGQQPEDALGSRFDSGELALIDASAAPITSPASYHVAASSVARQAASAKVGAQGHEQQLKQQLARLSGLACGGEREVNNNQQQQQQRARPAGERGGAERLDSPSAADRSETRGQTQFGAPSWTSANRLRPLLGLRDMDPAAARLARASQPADSRQASQQQQQQQLASQTSSIPSYSSIFNQQAQRTTDLDEELLKDCGEGEQQQRLQAGGAYKLGTVAPPAQKQHWSNLQAPGSRAPLKKQQAAALADANVGGGGKRLLVFNYEAPRANNEQRGENYDNKEKVSYSSGHSANNCDEDEQERDEQTSGDAHDDDDEEEGEGEGDSLTLIEEQFDERAPFRVSGGQHARAAKQQQDERHQQQQKGARQTAGPKSPGSAMKSKLGASKPAPSLSSKVRANQQQQQQRLNSLKRADSVQMQARKQGAQQTKISFNEHSATICHQLEHTQNLANCKKLDLMQQAHYLSCDCGACAKKRKLVGFTHGHGSAPVLAAPSYYQLNQPLHHQHLAMGGGLSKSSLLVEKQYPKTRAMHLVLKSIILVLCTLLLFLLLVGTALLTHLLPQMVDKITNVSRSFNVTIAGRR